ncbi:uncharacterized protein GGS22DRAFT_170502 [Annulohypoxylon maeteangense]|uniref:uncharacterized protein n=1 Tax=Annulohypoxylon maeteangense TaxID=1927788 RepID=UPI00200759B1|nr:uncharacterized protein GGS22DRAFT_170502 [Annulohypoxylon maeteangense]KAI0882228.1 hypothetical protein GGS22DRAFT_170502 [Annulohypoxylon maeteangense]
MAIQNEKERPKAVYNKARTEQYRRRQWLQVISNQIPRVTQDIKQEPFVVEPVRPSLDHESYVQLFACQLSKKIAEQYLDVISVPLPLPKNGTRFELLPQNIIDRICSYVPYENLLWLYQQSRALHRIIDPHLAPYETKASFTLRAERDFPQHYNAKPPNLGCYTCSRVLTAAIFATNQPLQALLRLTSSDEEMVVNLRRFCIYCGIHSGCHKPGDELSTRTGGRFWICDCLYILDDATPGCKGCKARCPLVPRGRVKLAASFRSREGS